MVSHVFCVIVLKQMKALGLLQAFESTTCIKIRTCCQYVGYIYYSENLNWAAQNPRLGCGLDIAVLSHRFMSQYQIARV